MHQNKELNNEAEVVAILNQGADNKFVVYVLKTTQIIFANIQRKLNFALTLFAPQHPRKAMTTVRTDNAIRRVEAVEDV